MGKRVYPDGWLVHKKEYDRVRYLRLREEKLEYSYAYYEAHKNDVEFKRKRHARSLRWARENPERNRYNQNLYKRLNYTRRGFFEYVGVVEACPKCGLRGYKRYAGRFNLATGHFLGWDTSVWHYNSLGGRTCWVGWGRL